MKLRKRLDLPMENKIKELRYAIVQSVPVMLGYLFLGFAFGLMLNDAGYGFWWAFFISLFVYAGSMQFVLVTLLTAGASLWYTLIMTLSYRSWLPARTDRRSLLRKYPVYTSCTILRSCPR